MKTRCLFAIAALLASTSLSATAAPVTFFGEDLNVGALPTPNSDAARNAFFSNLTGVGTETFEGIAVGTINPVLNFPGAGTATLTGAGSVNSGPDFSGRFPISGSNWYFTGANSAGITFSSAISAFGFYAMDIGDYGGQLTLTLTDILDNVTVLNVNNTIGSFGSTNGSALYFGFYDLANSYKSVAFGNSAGGVDGFGYDDLSIGTIEQVRPMPEPLTMSLFGAGLVGAAALRRRNRKA